MTAGVSDAGATAGVYYDPYDFDIDVDPYPLWKRMRDEVPLYYNEQYDFFALSRFDDVQPALVDWETYRSGRGSVLELIRADIDLPPGLILFEDPPIHDVHRGLLSRVFTPKKMSAIEPKVREFCARSLDPLVGTGGFDFVRDLGAQMPMRTIGMLLGIPEQDQEAIKAKLAEGNRLEEGKERAVAVDGGRLRRDVRRVRRLAHGAPVRRPHDRARHRRVRGRDRHDPAVDPRPRSSPT